MLSLEAPLLLPRFDALESILKPETICTLPRADAAAVKQVAPLGFDRERGAQQPAHRLARLLPSGRRPKQASAFGLRKKKGY